MRLGTPRENRNCSSVVTTSVAPQALSHRDVQTFAGKDVDHREGAKAPPVSRLIAHKIHAPHLIPRLGGSAFETMDGWIRERFEVPVVRRMPAGQFDPE
jgi:hypothetical protein